MLRTVRVSCLALALSLAFTAPGTAAAPEPVVYQWTDDAGTLHFTDRAWRIPSTYRDGAQPLEPRRDALSWTGGPASVRIPFEREGNLMKVRVELDQSVEASFYVDTGASHVSLPAQVAERLGFDAHASARTVAVRTAAGVIRVPAIELDSVGIGGAEVHNLLGTVNEELEIGLLGGAFFNHFNYSVDPGAGVIVLHPKDRDARAGGPAGSSSSRKGENAAEPPERAGGDT